MSNQKPQWQEIIEKSDKRTDLEIVSPDWALQQHHPTPPTNPMEAMMMETPGNTLDPPPPAPTTDPYETLETILGCDLDLDEIERAVLDAMFIGGHSVRDTAKILQTSASTVWRIKTSALERIRARAGWATIGNNETPSEVAE